MQLDGEFLPHSWNGFRCRLIAIIQLIRGHELFRPGGRHERASLDHRTGVCRNARWVGGKLDLLLPRALGQIAGHSLRARDRDHR